MSPKDPDKPASPPDELPGVIHLFRGCRVMLDEDLARLYGVETRALNQAVRRHPGRFPPDFMFPLSDEEWSHLRSQSVTSNTGRGGRRYPPIAFTEQGVAMLSSVLNSERAIAVNVELMRAFVRFRHFLASQEELGAKLKDLELRFEKKFDQNDRHLKMLVEALRHLRDQVRNPPPPPARAKRQIGFHRDDGDGGKKPKGRKRTTGN